MTFWDFVDHHTVFTLLFGVFVVLPSIVGSLSAIAAILARKAPPE